MKVKAAAAVEYDKARAEIDAIDAKSWNSGTIAAQSTGAGAGAAVVAFAARLGYDISQEDGERAFEWGRGCMLELAAAIGPGAINLFAWLLLGMKEAKPAEAPKRRPPTPVSAEKPVRWLASFLSGITATFRKEEPVISYPLGSARGSTDASLS